MLNVTTTKTNTYGSDHTRIESVEHTKKKQQTNIVEPFKAALDMEIQYSVFHFWLNRWILCANNSTKMFMKSLIEFPKQSTHTHNKHVD